MEEKKENVVTYTRYGTMENIEEKMYQNQWLLDQYRNKNKGIEIKDLYIDVNKSAMSNRPEFNRLMKDITLGKIDKVVVIGGISKLSRNMEELEKMKEYVEIITVEPTITVSNLNKPLTNYINENLVRDLLDSFEEYYKEENRKRSQRGQELKKKLKEERRRKYEMNQNLKQKEQSK